MTTKTPARRVRMPRAKREAQMLEVAERIFSEQGFHAATMDEIAEQVGVTKPLIYDYFRSKEGLLAAVVERARHQLLAALIDSWVAKPLDPARDRVRGVFHAFFRFMDDHDPAFAVLRTEGSLIGDAAASIERIRQQTAKALAEGISTLAGYDRVPSQQVVVMAEIMIGGVERLAVWRNTYPGMTADEAAELVMATTWDGLASLARS